MEVQKYLVSYANHFRLEPHLRLNTSVRQIKFDDVRQQWTVEAEGKGSQNFDKLVLAIGGLTTLPNIPKIEGIDLFKGTTLHARAFKKPEDFRGKRVVVVGFGNTAADTATALANVAQKVYIAHRNGARMVSFPGVMHLIFKRVLILSAPSSCQRQTCRPRPDFADVHVTELDDETLPTLQR